MLSHQMNSLPPLNIADGHNKSSFLLLVHPKLELIPVLPVFVVFVDEMRAISHDRRY